MTNIFNNIMCLATYNGEECLRNLTEWTNYHHPDSTCLDNVYFGLKSGTLLSYAINCTWFPIEGERDYVLDIMKLLLSRGAYLHNDAIILMSYDCGKMPKNILMPRVCLVLKYCSSQYNVRVMEAINKLREFVNFAN